MDSSVKLWCMLRHRAGRGLHKRKLFVNIIWTVQEIPSQAEEEFLKTKSVKAPEISAVPKLTSEWLYTKMRLQMVQNYWDSLIQATEKNFFNLILMHIKQFWNRTVP